MVVLLMLSATYGAGHGAGRAIATLAWIGFLLLALYFAVLGVRTIARRGRGAANQ
jgi:hypothetical protein